MNKSLTITIRQAEVSDAPVLHEMQRKLAEFHGPEVLFLSTVEDVKRDGFGTNARYESWLAEVDMKAAGMASFFLNYSTFKARSCLHLDNLFVAENFRGMSISGLLLRQIIKRANELHCWRIDLHVFQDNPAISVYEHYGFQPTTDAVYSLECQQ